MPVYIKKNPCSDAFPVCQSIFIRQTWPPETTIENYGESFLPCKLNTRLQHTLWSCVPVTFNNETKSGAPKDAEQNLCLYPQRVAKLLHPLQTECMLMLLA